MARSTNPLTTLDGLKYHISLSPDWQEENRKRFYQELEMEAPVASMLGASRSSPRYVAQMAGPSFFTSNYTSTLAQNSEPGPVTDIGDEFETGMLVTGPEGPPGPPGPIGEEGDTGEDGEAGDGTTGPKGIAGRNGPLGQKGPYGPYGPFGAIGEKGETGPPCLEPTHHYLRCYGPQGPTGPTGTQTGPPGVQGPKGYDGNPGIIGDTGPVGEEGPSGPGNATGPTGECSCCVNEDDLLMGTVAPIGGCDCGGGVWSHMYWLGYVNKDDNIRYVGSGTMGLYDGNADGHSCLLGNRACLNPIQCSKVDPSGNSVACGVCFDGMTCCGGGEVGGGRCSNLQHGNPGIGTDNPDATTPLCIDDQGVLIPCGDCGECCCEFDGVSDGVNGGMWKAADTTLGASIPCKKCNCCDPQTNPGCLQDCPDCCCPNAPGPLDLCGQTSSNLGCAYGTCCCQCVVCGSAGPCDNDDEDDVCHGNYDSPADCELGAGLSQRSHCIGHGATQGCGPCCCDMPFAPAMLIPAEDNWIMSACCLCGKAVCKAGELAGHTCGTSQLCGADFAEDCPSGKIVIVMAFAQCCCCKASIVEGGPDVSASSYCRDHCDEADIFCPVSGATTPLARWINAINAVRGYFDVGVPAAADIGFLNPAPDCSIWNIGSTCEQDSYIRFFAGSILSCCPKHNPCNGFAFPCNSSD